MRVGIGRSTELLVVWHCTCRQNCHFIDWIVCRVLLALWNETCRIKELCKRNVHALEHGEPLQQAG